MFRRTLYETKGGFDPELDNLEDWNLWVRYTLEQDFEMIDKVTSLYRVPARPEEAVRRQNVLDDYYAKAVTKHAALQVVLNPNQVVRMAEEMARDLYVVTLQRRTLRDAVLSKPWLVRLYYPMRRAANLMLRLARKMS